MATLDVNQSVRQIVNAVQRRLSLTETSALDANKTTRLILDKLNETVDECSDLGDWKTLFKMVQVSAVSSTGDYEITSTNPVKNIDQVYFQGRSSPLNPVDFRDLIRLRRTSAHGTPNQFAIIETSAVNPKVSLHPIPGTNQDGKIIDVTVFEKPKLYLVADTSAIPPFPSLMLIKGTEAKMVLDESGQEETDQYKTIQAQYKKMQTEAFNRLTADTGGDFQIVPGNG